MKKIILVITIILSLLALGGAGYYFVYQAAEIEPGQIFRNYVEKQVSSATVEAEEKYTATGTTADIKGSLDTSSKKFTMSADIKCTPKIQKKDVTISVTLQIENEKSYLRLNSITGQYVTAEGSEINLADTYSKIKNGWYVVVESDAQAKAQLDSGVYLFNSALLAPSYDTEKVVDALINRKAFTFSSVEKINGNYVIQFSSNKNAYLEVLKEVFPNLTSPDLILDSIFDEKSTIESTITVTESGEVISEQLTEKNLCEDIVSIYVGEGGEGLARDLTGTNTPRPVGSIKITPITTSKSIEDLSKDLNL